MTRRLLIFFGQLGDAVLSLPAARALRDHDPQSPLTVLASDSAAQIYRLAGFDEVWEADRSGWKHHPLRAAREIPELIWRLRRQRFALSVELHSFAEMNLLAWLVGIPRRVAMLRRTRSIPWLITDRPPWDDEAGALLDRYCTVLTPLGISVHDRRPRLSASGEARTQVRAALGDWNGQPLLGICPGAGHPGRRWPADRFAALIAALRSEDSSLKALVFAGPEEPQEMIAALAAVPGTRIFRARGIDELAAGLESCRLVVSNPTGPSHIAAAVGTRLVSLGEIPAFDPVGHSPDQVRIVRAMGSISSIPLEAALQSCRAQWRNKAQRDTISSAATGVKLD